MTAPTDVAGLGVNVSRPGVAAPATATKADERGALTSPAVTLPAPNPTRDPYYQDDTVTLHHGDCLDVLRELPDASVDAVVTDPPYALGFMGKEWDKIGDTGRGARARVERAAEVTPTGQGHTTSGGAYLAAGVDSLRSAGRPFQAWCEAWARECLRVLKPGGHLLAFGGTRTWHRLACAVEDAGFEIRDSLAWLYAQGFPKSLDVARAIDATALHGGSNSRRLREAEQAGDGDPYTITGRNNGIMGEPRTFERKTWAPETPEAARWQGWGTALKPAFEPVVVARKPLVGTVAQNVTAHGTGALNVDACRVPMTDDDRAVVEAKNAHARFGTDPGQNEVYGDYSTTAVRDYDGSRGRWPANVLLDGDTALALDEQAPRERPARAFPTFRYSPKAPSHERPRVDGVAHPTVKPLELMRWLVRLVTPPGGTVLEPFAGSGTTAEACVIEGFHCIAIEREADYLPLIRARLEKPIQAALDFGEAVS